MKSGLLIPPGTRFALITPRVLGATSIAGTVEQCAETVRQLAEHGIGHIIPRFATERA